MLCAAACSGGSGDGAQSSATHPSSAPASSSPTAAAGASQVLAKVKVGGNPCGVARLAGVVWVSDADRGLLFRIDPTTGTATQVARLDAKPCAITTAYGS